MMENKKSSTSSFSIAKSLFSVTEGASPNTTIMSATNMPYIVVLFVFMLILISCALLAFSPAQQPPSQPSSSSLGAEDTQFLSLCQRHLTSPSLIMPLQLEKQLTIAVDEFFRIAVADTIYEKKELPRAILRGGLHLGREVEGCQM